MSDEHNVTLLGQTAYCNRIFRTSLFELEGFRPQIRIETYQIVSDSLEPKLRSSMNLRLRQAQEVAEALLRGVDILNGVSA